MMKRYYLLTLLILFSMLIVGCSGGGMMPVEPISPADLPASEPASERETDSQRVLWGMWNFAFDPIEMEIVIEPVRNVEAHFNITPMIIPPACDDCMELAVNSFDPVTRIMDVDVTLRNPYPINGYDVRGILYTNDYGHLLENPDDWTKLFETPGGESLNPFKAFARNEPNRMFAGEAEHIVNYLVKIPAPPNYQGITYAVTASWPGNCNEPFSIGDFSVEGGLFYIGGSAVEISIKVWDWQGDVNKVTLVAPEITGQPFMPFTHVAGNSWALDLVNEEAAPVGEYECRIIATSLNSGDTALYDFVTIEITEPGTPTVTEVSPGSGEGGESYDDMIITGTNFAAPAEVWFVGHIPTTYAVDVVVVNSNTITCYIDIPVFPIGGIGPCDVGVTNGALLSVVGESVFEILPPTPDVTGAVPGTGETGHILEDVIISGHKFNGSGTQVKLRMAGEPDIVATDVNIFTTDLIQCDFLIPSEAQPGFYDVEVTNGSGLVGSVAALFVVSSTPQDGWARTWWGDSLSPWAYGVAEYGGSIYVCGCSTYKAAYLREYDTSGELISEAIFGSSSDDLRLYEVTTGDSGIIYLIGEFSGEVDFDPGPGEVLRTSHGSYDAFLLAVDSDISFLWVQTWGGYDKERADGILWHNDKIYITGYFESTVDFNPGVGEHSRSSNGMTDVFVSRFTDAGVFEWAETWGGSDEDRGWDLAMTSLDLLYVVGEFKDTVDFDWGVGVAQGISNGGMDVFVVEINGENYSYLYTWGGSNHDRAFCASISPSNYLYVGGEFYGSDVDFDPYGGVSNRSSNGATDSFVNIFEGFSPYHHVDAWTWGGDWYDRVRDIASSVDGIWIGGFFGGTADFDPGPGVVPRTSPGNRSVFLSHFNSGNEFQWVGTWGGTSNQYGQGVAVDSSGNSYICGMFSDLIDFDPGPGEDWHDGYQDAFLSKFPLDGSW